jgi:hypothetical protein
MPKRDIVHEAVKKALIKDGWVITADPYRIKYGDEELFIDLAAERLLTAERAGRKINEDIVLAFNPPEMRHLTEFAVA